MKFALANEQTGEPWASQGPEFHIVGGHQDYVWQRFRLELTTPEWMSTEILRGSCVVAVRIDAVRGRPPTSDMDLIDEGGIISHLCNKLQVDVTDNRVNVSVRVGLNGSDVLVFDACQVSNYKREASLSNSVHELEFNSSFPPFSIKDTRVSWRILWKLLASRHEDVTISVSLNLPNASTIPGGGIPGTLKYEPSSCPADIQILPNDDGPPIPCHKQLLSAYSDVLKQGLNGSFEECSQGFVRMNFTTVVVKKLLEYFSSRQLTSAEDYTQIVAFDLLRASHYYNLCHLWSLVVDMTIMMTYRRPEWFEINCTLDTIEFLLQVNDEKQTDDIVRNLVYVISIKHGDSPDIQLEQLISSNAAFRKFWVKYSMEVINLRSDRRLHLNA